MVRHSRWVGWGGVQGYQVKFCYKKKKKEKNEKSQKFGDKRGTWPGPGPFSGSGCGMRQRLIKSAGPRRERVAVRLAGGPDSAR